MYPFFHGLPGSMNNVPTACCFSHVFTAFGDPVEGDSGLAGDTISTIYSAYVSDERGGAEVDVKTY